MRAFEELKTLRQGWDSYDAPPPSAIAIANARRFVELAARKPERIAPSAVGGVGVSHRENGRKVYTEFYNDGRVYALYSARPAEPTTRRVWANDESLAAHAASIPDYLGTEAAKEQRADCSP